MVRTFIYGSCVSRDTFQQLPPGQFELVQYVARQSLISATAPPTSRPLPHIDTTSAFQRRMLEGDWSSSLLPLISDHADSIDLFLWDLCDERLGLRQLEPIAGLGQHAMATRSVDGIRAGMEEHLQNAPLIEFGTRKHRLLFLQAARAFVSYLRACRLLEKTLILAPAWARHTSDGTPTPTSFGLGPIRANRIYNDYYATLRHIGNLPILTRPQHLVIADALHPWGRAPFHYTESVYEALIEQIQRKLHDRGPR